MENQALTVTPHQLALDIFEDMSGQGRPIHQSTREIGFIRNNIFTRVGGLGIAARRILDAAYFIVATKAPEELLDDKVYTFTAEVNYFKWLMRYEGSRNHAHLVSQMRSAANARVDIMTAPSIEEITEKDSWGTIGLLGDCYIERNVVFILLSGRVIKYVINPYKAHWLSLRASTSFSLSLARAIYDRLIPCEGPGITEWFAYSELLEWPGKVGESRKEVKEFKKHFLVPAIQQLNQVSDFDVSWEPNAERVPPEKLKIRFRFTKKQGADAARAGIDDSMYLTLHNEFAFDAPEFDRIAKNRADWTDEVIERAIEYTRAKVNEGKVTSSPKGYLLRAIEGKFRLGDADRRMAEVKAKQLEDSRNERRGREDARAKVEASLQAQNDLAMAKLSDEINIGKQLFEAADDNVRKDLVQSFVSQLLPQRLIDRQGVARERLTPATILTVNRVVAEAFCTHVYARSKKARAKD
ncbi:replication initiation protein [Cupriavidus sp. UYPR2.512]|uniref:replication initiation protein n=1 Tax=Cupriavidus sp. UYPR2.512 TaxID=1080187 RepID=UPI000375176A|nr:replication initiation protein [Cupriavidus sp. UYPR2.512]UIF89115.1 replication initiation protein [Cupriavidus necator]